MKRVARSTTVVWVVLPTTTLTAAVKKHSPKRKIHSDSRRSIVSSATSSNTNHLQTWISITTDMKVDFVERSNLERKTRATIV